MTTSRPPSTGICKAVHLMSCTLTCSPPMRPCLQVMRDPDTGISKGFGFISFDSFEASGAPMLPLMCLQLVRCGSALASFPLPPMRPQMRRHCTARSRLRLYSVLLLCSQLAARCFETGFAAARGSWQLVCAAAAAAMGRLFCAHAWLVNNHAIPALVPTADAALEAMNGQYLMNRPLSIRCGPRARLETGLHLRWG